MLMVFFVHYMPCREPIPQGCQSDHWPVLVKCSYKISLHLIVAVYPLGTTARFLQQKTLKQSLSTPNPPLMQSVILDGCIWPPYHVYTLSWLLDLL